MRAALILLLLATVGCTHLGAPPAKRSYPKRWFFVFQGLQSEQEADEVLGLVQTATAHGLNGMVLSAGLDRIERQSPEWLRRLERIKAGCDRAGIEIIPAVFNVGYGGSLLAYDRNLAAGMPAKGTLFVVRGLQARFQSDSPVALSFPPPTGKSISIDSAVSREGRGTLRFDAPGPARLEKEVAVQPHRSYRIRAWIRTENARPATLLSIRAFAPDRRNLSFFEPALPATSDWQPYSAGFNSWYADKVQISLGIEEAQGGKVWVDDIRIEEAGLLNVIRRPGAPVVVRSEKTGEVYEEGRDYAPISDPNMDFRFDREGPAIALLPGGRIRDGERLRVDFFHGTTIYRDQVGVCPSEPRVIEIWRRQVPLIRKYISPKTWLVSTDEVRIGGFCETCRRRKMPAAAIIGDVTTQAYRLVRDADPQAEVFVWSDMFDPNHNARPRYHLVDGDLTGSWNYLPRDIGVVCWYFQMRRRSLDHFSRLGFRTLAAAYYDGDDLSNPQGWLEALDATPGALGIMYTTWARRYQLLGAFGDLVPAR